MLNLQEKMETLTKQYSQVMQQVNDGITMKAKLRHLRTLNEEWKLFPKIIQRKYYVAVWIL